MSPDGHAEARATELLSDPHDRDAMLAEVLHGLRQPLKRIPSKYHYDARGSELFERITQLEEYYPTRTERALLERWIPVWVGEQEPAALVELGPGSADKTRTVLDAMTASASGGVYVPVDVSGDFLQETAARLRVEYPEISVEPEVADISQELDLSASLPEPAWIAFLGSTIGNFETDGAVRLLARVASRLRRSDRFLLGVDLRPGPGKSRERIELAYNDPEGVTEAFSGNLLEVLNRELGCDFDIDAFRYRSVYDMAAGRVETYQVSTRSQRVSFPDGGVVELAEGEPIRTEISAKYDRQSVEELFEASGLEMDEWVEDERGWYALALASVREEARGAIL